MRTFKLYSFKKFQLYNAVLSTIVKRVLHEIFIPSIAKTLSPFTDLSQFPLPSSPWQPTTLVLCGLFVILVDLSSFYLVLSGRSLDTEKIKFHAS